MSALARMQGLKAPLQWRSVLPLAFIRTSHQHAETQVTLQQGELLYIPPLWAHQVVSLARSASLAIWSPTAETMSANSALDLGLPFLPSAVESELVQSIVLLKHLLRVALEELDS